MNCPNNDKKQPWKAHWPAPAQQAAGIEYGVEKGAVVVVDGTSAPVKKTTDSEKK